MKTIITINRQFASGGREIGKRLADALKLKFYDKELLQYIYKKTHIDKELLEKEDETIHSNIFNFAFGRSFSAYQQPLSNTIQLETSKIILEEANKYGGVFVGRCADYILRDHNPLKVYIYSSSDDFKIKRCFDKVPNDKEAKSDKEMLKEINKIESQRKKYYEYYTGQSKEDFANYDLCIDTSKIGIKNAVEIILTAAKLLNK